MKHYAVSIHEKDEPIQCDICETTFLQEYSLKQHKQFIHEKIKPVKLVKSFTPVPTVARNLD